MKKCFIHAIRWLLPVTGILVWSIQAATAASEVAVVSFSYDEEKSRGLLSIESPLGISAAQVKLDIPEDITVTNIQLSGFMTGATYLSLGSEHRFFLLSANGEKSGSLILSVTVPEGTARTISLREVNLLDSAGKPVPIDTSLPADVVISQKETATVNPAVKFLDFWPYVLAVGLLSLATMIFSWRREIKGRINHSPPKL